MSETQLERQGMCLANFSSPELHTVPGRKQESSSFSECLWGAHWVPRMLQAPGVQLGPWPRLWPRAVTQADSCSPLPARLTTSV